MKDIKLNGVFEVTVPFFVTCAVELTERIHHLVLLNTLLTSSLYCTS
jgi:PHP family Zn ribbon phosphoesterase